MDATYHHYRQIGRMARWGAPSADRRTCRLDGTRILPQYEDRKEILSGLKLSPAVRLECVLTDTVQWTGNERTLV